jgi:hypothetical protein
MQCAQVFDGAVGEERRECHGREWRVIADSNSRK